MGWNLGSSRSSSSSGWAMKRDRLEVARIQFTPMFKLREKCSVHPPCLEFPENYTESSKLSKWTMDRSSTQRGLRPSNIGT